MKILVRFLIALIVLRFQAFVIVLAEEPAPTWSPYASPLTSQDVMSQQARSEFGAEEEVFYEIQNRFGQTSPQKSPDSVLPGQRKGLIQGINLGGSWIPSNGDEGFGMTEFDASVTIGLPGPNCGSNKGPSYFILTPNFSYTNTKWKGWGEFPDSLYNTGLTIGWMKPINPQWTLMAYAMPSYSSDGKATDDAVRCPVMVGMNWNPNARWKVVFGAAYLDRSDISVLPFGGLVYTPNEDWRFELMAPQAKIARRLHAFSGWDCERWGYLFGGFDGGTWAVETWNQQSDVAMYREYTIGLGCESLRKSGHFKWNAEIGYLFGRKMEFDRNTQPTFKPDDSLVLRLKCSF